jgi:membrane protein required for colicin V production
MNGLDFAVIGILLLSMLLGLWRGLLCEVLSVLGWPFAIVLSKLSAGSIAPLLPIEQEEMRIAIAYVLVFVVALIAWGILARLIARLLKAIGPDWADRAMGGLFGVLRGALLVLVLVWLAGLTHMPEQAFWRSSLTGRSLEDIALLTKSWLPDNIGQRIHYRIHG